MAARTRANLAKAAVTTFGAALTSLNIAPQLEAAIVDLSGNFDPTSVSTSTSDAIDFIPDLAGPDFFQYNDFTSSSTSTSTTRNGTNTFTNTNTIGKRLLAFYPANIVGVNLKSANEIISAGSSFTATLNFSSSASGTVTIGFKTAGNNVGWWQMDLGGYEGEVVFLAAAWNNAGGPILAGTLSVPEPTSAALAGLAALALGASGVRRLRKRRAKQSESA
jgi:hypothetical protein